MQESNQNKLILCGIAVLSGAAIGFVGSYRVAKPAQYLVRTGLLINDPMGMRVGRKAFAMPYFQKLEAVQMQPRNLHFELKCLSKEYLPFKMPVSYTLSPFDPTGIDVEEYIDGTPTKTSAETLFKRYAQKIDPLQDFEFNLTLGAIIHGETRVLAAKMSIDAINDDREEFKKRVISNVQQLLLPYGLRVDNANIAELTEEKRENGDMGYLEARERKKLSDAVQQSEINVAEATKCGDIGKKQREATTRQEKAKLEATTKEIEFATQQQIAKAAADLAVVNAESKRRSDISNVEAMAAASQKKEELQCQIEEHRANQLLSAKRADTLTTEKVKAECLRVAAEIERDAIIIKATGAAQAMEIEAKAIRFQGEQDAAIIFAKLNAEAQGKQALLEAQAEGTQKLVMACDGKPELLTSVLNIYNGIPQVIARENANAVQGLKPQIWSMSGDDAGSQISKMLGSLAPLADVYQKITK